MQYYVADHFTKIYKKMFPDIKLKISCKFACSQTKTTMLVKKALAPTLEQEVVQHLRSSSNGSFLKQQDCLTVPGHAYL